MQLGNVAFLLLGVSIYKIFTLKVVDKLSMVHNIVFEAGIYGQRRPRLTLHLNRLIWDLSAYKSMDDMCRRIVKGPTRMYGCAG